MHGHKTRRDVFQKAKGEESNESAGCKATVALSNLVGLIKSVLFFLFVFEMLPVLEIQCLYFSTSMFGLFLLFRMSPCTFLASPQAMT